MTLIALWVPGTPAPQGSKTLARRGNKTVMVDSNPRLKAWRTAVANTAEHWCQTHGHTEAPYGGTSRHPQPMWIHITAVHTRPPSRPKHELWHAVTPDADKVLRATIDGLTAAPATGKTGARTGIITDDSRIVDAHIQDTYGPITGALIHLGPVHYPPATWRIDANVHTLDPNPPTHIGPPQ